MLTAWTSTFVGPNWVLKSLRSTPIRRAMVRATLMCLRACERLFSRAAMTARTRWAAPKSDSSWGGQPGSLTRSGQRAGSGGCHVLGKIEALQPKESMGHAEHPSDDLQGLAGILACPDGTVSGYPGSFRVVDLGESGGGGLVSDRQ